MKRNRKIPFWITLKAWFLFGDQKELAKIDHNYERNSYEWDVERAKILNVSDESLQRSLIDIDHKYEKINDYEYDIKKIELKYDPKLDEYYYQKALIEAEHKHHIIDNKEREKKLATLNEEPWGEVNLVSDPEDPDFGTFTPNYNKYYIEWLRDNGYEGKSEEDVIDNYVNHICKYVAIETFDGVGDFSERISESEIAAQQHIKERTTPSKKRRDDGRTEFK